MPTKTPGKLFVVILKPLPVELGFTVLTIDEDQGKMLRARKFPVYDTSSQAHIVCKKLNAKVEKK